MPTGGKILSDMADNNNSSSPADIVSKHERDLISKLKGRGLKFKAIHASPEKTGTKRNEAAKQPNLATPKRTYRGIFAYPP